MRARERDKAARAPRKMDTRSKKDKPLAANLFAAGQIMLDGRRIVLPRKLANDLSRNVHGT